MYKVLGVVWKFSGVFIVIPHSSKCLWTCMSSNNTPHFLRTQLCENCAEPSLVIMPAFLMTTNIFLILLLSPRETCQDTEWVGLLVLKPGPPETLPHQGSCPTCPCCFSNQDLQARADAEPLHRVSPHFSSFPSQVQRRMQKAGRGATRIRPVLPGPWDLNVKQMGHKHSSTSCTVLFSSFDTSFGYICLFFWKCICAHELRIKVHRQKPFSRDVFPLSLKRKRMGKRIQPFHR